MQEDDRRAMLRSLNDDQYHDVMNVIAKMPLIEVQIKAEVLDDEDSSKITAGAIVTVTANLTRRNMSTLYTSGEGEENNVEEAENSEVLNILFRLKNFNY